MFCIMVVEDNYNTGKLMEAVLVQNGYEVILAKDGIDALEKMDNHHVDLIVLDLMLPRMDGYEFTRILRESNNNIPILMVTAKETPADKKKGFIVGTDDYMVKPVDEEEMILRIAALLRRSQIANEHKLTIGETVLDYDSFTVTRGDNVQELPNKEFLLLFKLLSYQNKIFTRRSLMDEIWDMNSETDERTVDVHINRLRDRFKDNTDFEIVTVRGLGYKAVVRHEQNKIS
ncbi:MAG: response regulator transcription factor [Clostridiaceae bacterium]|nr:response regulator transcription factor [Clostridiaceae bacterium]